MKRVRFPAFGNALSQDPNSAASAGLQYDPYTGLTIHVNNNTRELAGVVRKGLDPFVAGVTRKVWGTDTNDDPNWRETVLFEGGQNIDIEYVGTTPSGIKRYRINYVPY